MRRSALPRVEAVSGGKRRDGPQTPVSAPSGRVFAPWPRAPPERAGGHRDGARIPVAPSNGLPSGGPTPAIGGEGEAYVVSPASFEAFAAGRELAPATVRNCVFRLGRHRSRASRSGAANRFRGMLADGSRVEGLVSPGNSSGTRIGRPGRTPRWSARAGDRPLPGASAHRRPAPHAGRGAPRPRAHAVLR